MESSDFSGQRTGTRSVQKGPQFPVVGIGASAGGIKALKQLFAGLPPEPGMAFVVILHLSQQHESNLAAIIQQGTRMPVTQINETVKVEPNHVYVIPPAKYLEMADGVIKLAEPEKVKGRRVPIDLFFRTLAEAYGRRAVSIILSGTGTDGTLGIKRVKELDGITFSQEPTDADYDGMPRSAISTGLVDIVLPVAEIPKKLMAVSRFVEHETVVKTESTPATIEQDDTAKTQRETEGDGPSDVLRDILRILRVRTGHDFSNYKRPTLIRRLTRRMQVREREGLSEYLNLLREKPDEIYLLLKDILITVTNFFRDKNAFDSFQKNVVPRLFDNKDPTDTVRVWVVGCATGEEAYSIAILLHEFASTLVEPPKIQVFATDIDEDAIRIAREFRYEANIVLDVSAERLRQYFVKEGECYRVKKEIREMVMFAPHNVLRDPPFSRLDLVSCRNLLIYLNRKTQTRVLEIFSFALRREGYLFLGAAETAEVTPDLFIPCDKKNRLYKCSVAKAAHPVVPALPLPGKWEVRIPERVGHETGGAVSFGELHHKLVERYAPPSVLVNEEYEIVHASENAFKFLKFSGGEPSRNLLKVASPSIQLDLRAALNAAKQEKRANITPNVAFHLDGSERMVNLIVRPPTDESYQGFYLVIFEDITEPKDTGDIKPSISRAVASDKTLESVVQRLEEEIHQTRERLRATIEQSETSTEELKASNEELQAMNEELRSASEELETSKEELQSVNEELSTVNQELKEKIDEISRSNSDMQNLMSSTDIATLFLDRELRIEGYTPRVLDIFNVIPSDIGRPLDHVTNKLEYDGLSHEAAAVLRTLRTTEHEVRDSAGRYYLVRFSPYRTTEDRIDGVVASFLEVTEIKQSAQALHESQKRLSAIINQATVGIVQSDLSGKILLVNDRFCEMTGYSQSELLNKTLQNLTHPENVAHDTDLIARASENGEQLEIETRLIRKDGSVVWVHNSASAITDTSSLNANTILSVLLDVTARRETETALFDSEARFRTLAEAAPALIWFDDPQGNCLFVNQRYLDFSGKTSEELQGHGWQLVIHPDDADGYIRDFSAAQRERRPFHHRVRALHLNNEWRWLESFAHPLLASDGTYLGHVGVSTDITASVDAEKALKDADQRKDRFLATLGHELRNPIAAILPALEVSRRGSESQRETARRVIERQVGRVTKLVDDLLDISRITQGKITLRKETLTIDSVIDSALETARELFTASGQELSISFPESPIYVQADPLRLAQVILNLLTNASRYTRAKGSISLTAERQDSDVLVRIKDTGIGIAPEALPHIFEMFTQGSRTGDQIQDGLGIGLNLVKTLTELHGGSVEAHSDGLDQGSEFVVRLPLATDQSPSTQQLKSEKGKRTATSKSRQILIVDDNTDSAKMLETVLTLDGHDVKLAFDGKTAIQIAREFRPQIIFLDLGLPDITGYQVAAQVRQDLPAVSLVALSGWGRESDRRRSRDAGFDHHFVKPLDLDEFENLLATLNGD